MCVVSLILCFIYFCFLTSAQHQLESPTGMAGSRPPDLSWGEWCNELTPAAVLVLMEPDFMALYGTSEL